MMIEMTLNLIGASALDFTADDGTRYNHIKLIAMVENKRGLGSISQTFKYNKPSDSLDVEFGFMQSGKVYPASCKGLFQSDGKQVSFVIEQVDFLDGKTTKGV